MTKEELEKEAEEYIKANNLEWELECHRTSPIGEVKQAYLASAEPREKRIVELEKENAELKAVERMALYSKMSDQLTKAKEIIEKLLNAFASNDFFEEEELDAMAEAEQFLNEVEK